MAEKKLFRQRYQIERNLFRRHSGNIYLVTDLKSNGDEKMMKIVRLGGLDPQTSRALIREAQILSKLDHDHIVKFYESFIENECLCIVMEYCEGGDLDQRLSQLKKNNQTLDENRVVEWLLQILLAVQYLHKSRILHRNLKAKNLFLKNNQIKIGGFHCAQVLDLAKTFVGTPIFMAPEVMKEEGHGTKSDVWSVGCLLYEMCTLQHAFDGKGITTVISNIVEGQTPQLPKQYSKELNDLFKKMLTKSAPLRPTISDILKNPIFAALDQSSAEKCPPDLLKRRKMPKPFYSGIRSTITRTLSVDRLDSEENRTSRNRFEYPTDLHRLQTYPPTRSSRLLIVEPKYAPSPSIVRFSFTKDTTRTNV